MLTNGKTPPWIERAVLIYGPRKAGTSLFLNLLDGGEEVFVYPYELKLKWFVRKPGRGEDAGEYYERSRIPRVDSPHLDLDRYKALWGEVLEQRTISGMARLVRFDASATFASCSSTPAKVRMWCAKEVGGPTGRIFQTWRRLFPEGKGLFITRDPRMVTRAVLNDRRRRGIRLSPLQIAHETLDPMRVVAAQSRMLGDPDVMVLAYEDLVADTPAVMAKVAEFLGVAYTPKFEEPTTFSEPVVVRTASRQTTAVFQSASSWKDGLPWHERMIVVASYALGSLLPRYRVDYASLRRRLPTWKAA